MRLHTDCRGGGGGSAASKPVTILFVEPTVLACFNSPQAVQLSRSTSPLYLLTSGKAVE